MVLHSVSLRLALRGKAWLSKDSASIREQPGVPRTIFIQFASSPVIHTLLVSPPPFPPRQTINTGKLDHACYRSTLMAKKCSTKEVQSFTTAWHSLTMHTIRVLITIIVKIRLVDLLILSRSTIYWTIKLRFNNNLLFNFWLPLTYATRLMSWCTSAMEKMNNHE